jgi:MerR family transcriptional regulator, mercuric resistance operon regulatory protein
MSKRLITNSRAAGISIGELSRRTGVQVETIRYYEKIGLVPAPARTDGGRRSYATAELRLVNFIRRSRELGFSLKEIRDLLALGGPSVATCADVCDIGIRHLSVIRAKIADLKRLERYLDERMARCSGDAVPDCALLDELYAGVGSPAPA